MKYLIQFMHKEQNAPRSECVSGTAADLRDLCDDLLSNSDAYVDAEDIVLVVAELPHDGDTRISTKPLVTVSLFRELMAREATAGEAR